MSADISAMHDSLFDTISGVVNRAQFFLIICTFLIFDKLKKFDPCFMNASISKLLFRFN